VVKIVSDRQIVHAYEPDVFVYCGFLLELFLCENIVRISGRFIVHGLHIVIHVNNLIFVHICDYLISSTCVRINIINVLNHIIHVCNLIAFSICGWSSLKPAIFKSHFLDSACCRFDISDTLLTGNAFCDQELFVCREILIDFCGISTPPSS